MTALIIIGSIVLVIVLLCMFSITVYVSITNQVKVSVGAFGYRYHLDFEDLINPHEKVAKVKKKKIKKKKRKMTISTTKKAKVTERTFAQTVEIAISLIKSVAKPTVKLLKHVRIKKLSLYMTVCADDADDTAIRYGEISMAIYNLLGQLDNQITLQVKSVDIIPDFVSDEAVYRITFKVKLRIWYIIVALLCMITQFLTNTIKNNKNKRALLEPKMEMSQSPQSSGDNL